MINLISISETGQYYGGKDSFDHELVNLKEAAEIAGTSKQYVCKLCSSNKIESIKLPVRLIDKESLIRILEG